MTKNKIIENELVHSFLLLTRILNCEISYDDLIFKIGSSNEIIEEDLLYVATEYFDLKTKKVIVKLEKLRNNPLPAIVKLKDDKYSLLFSIENDKYKIYDFDNSKQILLEKDEFEKIYDGEIILVSKDEKNSDSTIRNFGLSWFIKSFFKQDRLIYHVLFAAFIIQIFALITPLFTMIIIDKVFSSSGNSTLEVLVIGLFIIAIFDFIISYSRKHLLSHMTSIIDVTMVSKFFRHLTSLPLSFFSSKQSGDVVARFKEVESIRNFISSGLLTSIIDFPFGIIFLVVMFLFSPSLTIIVLIAIIIIFLLYGVANPILKERLKKKLQLSTDSQSYLFDCVSSIETIKSMSIEPTIRRDYEEQLAKQTKHNAKTDDISGNISQIASFVNKITVALCLWIGAIGVLNGDMTAGQLIAFNMLIGRIMAPAQRIAQTLQQIYQVKISTKRVQEIFNTKEEISINSTQTNLPKLKGEVLFDKVSFKYNEEAPLVLNNINLKVNIGDIIGVVGKSGSGKTTFTRLLQRLFHPTSGKISIDGFDISTIDPNWLRRQIGVVMQDNLLLNKSIKDNITLSNPRATMKEVEYVCQLSGASDFILSLPKAYDTIVGERGNLLSTGQRQRIAIARALINNPKILIFDEATSAIDFESEIIIQKNLKKICEGRTVFIVSHRVSVLKITNKIVSLYDGKIIELGTKEELLRNEKGYFHNLCKAQNILSEI
ncbi:peptidase domain-containing ABC transporter [Aliarcobacter butzleri]|uniref:peptidase domain-containing ABC transporter n=1 Tax=Aliarcobacter butzleri TaxID=28197 RepID=UPI0021B2D1E8|nr:type I secretion system permease/ATPase [Aliarcobacter butzleri]MCT7618833.1 type I secretion system permease/ATPase [Aliarcobacter butzleri]